MTRGLALTLIGVQLVLSLADPDGFTYLRPLLVIVQIAALPGALAALVFVPSVRALVDEKTRILHGLEHATIAVLAERGIHVHNGVTLRGLFDLWFVHDGQSSTRVIEIHDATTTAVRRIAAGEHELAYSRRCGTSAVVAELLCALAIAGMGAYAIVRGTATGYAFAGTVAAVVIARLASPWLGLIAQRLLTVSTRRGDVHVGIVEPAVSPSGQWIHYAVYVDVNVAPAGTQIGEPV